jgi:hypothetical protein
MYTTAHHKIRHQCFEAFWYTHHLAFFFMIALYTHATGCFVRDTVDPDYISTFPFYSTDHCLGYFSWRFIIWPGILYFGERVWREIRARRATRLSKVLVHPSGMFSVTNHGLVDRAHSCRCHGVANHQTKLQVRPRSVALHPGSRCLRVSMASRKSFVLFLPPWFTYFPCVLVYNHLRAGGPLSFCPHPPGWGLDPSTRRASWSGTVSRCRSHLSCNERLRERDRAWPWRLH